MDEVWREGGGHELFIQRESTSRIDESNKDATREDSWTLLLQSVGRICNLAPFKVS